MNLSLRTSREFVKPWKTTAPGNKHSKICTAVENLASVIPHPGFVYAEIRKSEEIFGDFQFIEARERLGVLSRGLLECSEKGAVVATSCHSREFVHENDPKGSPSGPLPWWISGQIPSGGGRTATKDRTRIQRGSYRWYHEPPTPASHPPNGLFKSGNCYGWPKKEYAHR